MTLTEFLLTRIAEDEAAAREATPGPWRWEGDYPSGHCPHSTEWADHGPDLISPTVETLPDGTQIPETAVLRASGYDASSLDVTDADAAHIARHDPGRILAECEAKRRIVELHRAGREGYSDRLDYCSSCAVGDVWDGYIRNYFPCDTLRALAAIYADHEDFQEEWRP